MKGQFLFSARNSFVEPNIYADKSSVILDWLLSVGIHKSRFSLREVIEDRQVSIGLVQRVFKVLVNQGILETEGIRTGKKFILKKPHLLFSNWRDHYSIVKKCKMWTYSSAFRSKGEMIKEIKRSKLVSKVSLALHAAAEEFNCKNTNLDTLELYLLDPYIRGELEVLLRLSPQERGYKVLLVEPHYKSLLAQEGVLENGVQKSSAILTVLDLYHYPLRGLEQAEFMMERLPELRNIYQER